MWNARDQKLPRFLLAWVIGYLVYLELLSSKPGTYMVQTMFPALALAVSTVVVGENGAGKRPEWSLFTWPTAYAALPLAIFAAIFLFTGEWPTPVQVVLIALVAALFILSGHQGSEGQLRRWSATGIAALALFAITLLGSVLPSIGKIWPAKEIARAIAACPASRIGLVGFREPSGRFVLGVPPEQQVPENLASKNQTPELLIVEDRWNARMATDLTAGSRSPLPRPSGCVSAYNVMRGCALHFRIYEIGGLEPCTLPSRFACGDKQMPAAPEKHGDCD
jgi:hypothetical protein